MRKILENKYVNVDESDIGQVVAALYKGQLAGTAEVVQAYEEKLADFFGVKHALAVSSGTAALHLLLYVYDVGPGDEVIVPPTAPIMSALPILAVGAKPVFVDVQPDSFSYDIADLKKKTTRRTKAIVSVPMWGYPTETKEVFEFAQAHKIPFIEDASHCHGSTVYGRFVGTNSDVGFFSTQERKMVTTGEGGFILTDDDETAAKVCEVRDFGKPVRNTPELRAHLNQYGYLFGLNFRLAALSAALGISQLHKLPKKIGKRTANADDIKQQLAELPWLHELGMPEDALANYYSMVMFIDRPKASSNDIARHLYEAGIVSDTYRFGIQPLYKLPIFKEYALPCPNATKLLQRIITLPTHEGLTNDDIERIVLNLKKYQ